ncbi:hypothetical protein KUTeg_019690 [Tegillarca granosa]|uniref:Adenine phosphoribosyltransferase n=1 Tax=Tegillarca granosa TaxID=220873 RepID=A0ABQ9EDB9_TEGGR|nr:hypothetical protein KUTeg_019690 [Tegillarca granosa]
MTTDKRIEDIKKIIRDYQDFPKPGVLFRDVFPVVKDPSCFKKLTDLLVEHINSLPEKVDVIVGLESRGFIFGPIIAQALNIGFVPVRKAGKLPGELIQVEYSLEYGKDKFEIQKDAVTEGQKVVVVDDLLATGGTMKAACQLMDKVKAKVLDCLVVIELTDLNGRQKVPYQMSSLIKY